MQNDALVYATTLSVEVSTQWPGVKCGYADVVTGNLRMLLRINIRKLPCITSAHPQNTHV